MPHRTIMGGQRTDPWLASHAMWWTCMRFADQASIHLRELERLEYQNEPRRHGQVGYVALGSVSTAGTRNLRRGNPVIRATPKGLSRARFGIRCQRRWRPVGVSGSERTRCSA